MHVCVFVFLPWPPLSKQCQWAISQHGCLHIIPTHRRKVSIHPSIYGVILIPWVFRLLRASEIKTLPRSHIDSTRVFRMQKVTSFRGNFFGQILMTSFTQCCSCFGENLLPRWWLQAVPEVMCRNRKCVNAAAAAAAPRALWLMQGVLRGSSVEKNKNSMQKRRLVTPPPPPYRFYGGDS